ncbi:hypothetical protein CSUI_009404 [Cystoisospora suis]|uniref:Uncharacterized protein n=1 Tax=Cystoisospora suis TaxID=483139 RepID=A0A2C6KI36_9APIC|nr:hypothetical protein CSUI_009404 [Cystoisospora suis]
MPQQAPEHPQRAIRRCGDIWKGRYRPTLLPGRARAMEADMRRLLSEFVSMVRTDRVTRSVSCDTELGREENSGRFMVEGAFEVVSYLVFKHRFSCIHQAALLETQEEVWQLLLLVWQDILRDPLVPSATSLPSSYASLAEPPSSGAGCDDLTRSAIHQSSCQGPASRAPHDVLCSNEEGASRTHKGNGSVPLLGDEAHTEESVFLYRVGCVLLLPWLLYTAPGPQGAHREGLGHVSSSALQSQGSAGDFNGSSQNQSAGRSSAEASTSGPPQESPAHRREREKRDTAQVAEKDVRDLQEVESHGVEEETCDGASQTGQQAVLPVAALVSIGEGRPENCVGYFR